MRALLVTLVLFIATTAHADIPRPSSLDQTLDLMLERILPTHPDAQINRTESNITLDPDGGTIINPDNIHAVLRTTEDGREREAALDGFIATMIAAMDEPALDGLPLDQVYPVVRHMSFAQASGATELYFEPFIGDMVKVYAIDYPDRVAYVTDTNLTDAGITIDAVQEAAFANLATKLAQTQILNNGPGYMVITDGFYESSMLLDDALWADIAGQLNDDIVMIVPSRDVVVFGAVSDPDIIDFLSFSLQDALANGTHPLSELMYIWRDGSWQVLTR